jgi:hypothetical protein
MLLLQVNLALAAEPAAVTVSVDAPTPQQTFQTRVPFEQLQRPSRNPINAYRGANVAPPSMENSVRLNSLVRNGKIYLSLRDAINLALENNLDMVIARYNLPIAWTDIQRTRAGGQVRGVNTGVVSGTPGGGAGGAGARARARAARRAARAARAPELPASSRQRWAPVPRCQATIPIFSCRLTSITPQSS